jgi:hypothetical protein
MIGRCLLRSNLRADGKHKCGNNTDNNCRSSH